MKFDQARWRFLGGFDWAGHGFYGHGSDLFRVFVPIYPIVAP